MYSSYPTCQFHHQTEKYFDTLGANLYLNQMKNLPHKFMSRVIFLFGLWHIHFFAKAQCSFIPSSFVPYDLSISSIECSFTIRTTSWN